MRLLDLDDNLYVGVTDIDGASSWYQEKLDLKPVTVACGDADDCITLGYSNKEGYAALTLGRRTPDSSPRPIFASANCAKARDLLISRGVDVGPLEVDRQGTPYFVFRDMENNEVEVAELP